MSNRTPTGEPDFKERGANNLSVLPTLVVFIAAVVAGAGTCE